MARSSRTLIVSGDEVNTEVSGKLDGGKLDGGELDEEVNGEAGVRRC